MAPLADPVLVDGSETVSRFVFERDKINGQGIKFRAFFDPKGSGLSVSRTSGLLEREIWQLGDDVGRGPAVGCGDLIVSQIAAEIGLRTIVAEPPPRHALIVGWPMDDRDRHRSVAQQLAALARPRLRSLD